MLIVHISIFISGDIRETRRYKIKKFLEIMTATAVFRLAQMILRYY